jgi:hypothetical protein
MQQYRKSVHTRQALAMAVAIGLGFAGTAAYAQSTVGAVYGTADAGAQVELVNLGNGATRAVTVGADGKFNVSSLLPGDYKITETAKGQTVSRTVTVVAGQGFNLNLVSADAASSTSAENLGAVSVTANSLPPVDVSTVQVNTVMTAEQMKSLPIARNQTAVALLTPGAVRGDGAFGNLASFSGASVAENSYYVNGFNATNFFQSLKFSQVPFEAIDQQSIQEGGYGAEYGNSTGGVVSVLTKRGTNEWKGGVDYTWNPASLQAGQPTVYLKNGSLSQVNSGNKNFQLANNGAAVANSSPGSSTDFTDRWSAWIGGPLIKDKLFFFGIVSDTTTNDASYGGWFNNGGDTTATAGGGYQSTSDKQPYWLVKLDWNINESNILEYTGFSDTDRSTSQVYDYGFDERNDPYHTHYLGSVYNKQGGQTNILKYTGYITDDFTISAQYGRSINKRVNTATTADGTLETYNGDINTAANSPGCPRIVDQRTPVTDGLAQKYPSCSFAGTLSTPDGQDTNSQARIDFEYKLGDHDLTAGWGRTRFTAITGQAREGGAVYTYSSMPGPNDGTPVLDHEPTADPVDNIVQRQIFATGANVGLTQKYYYLQDAWHITDNFLARIGVRNDGFENQNGLGQSYVKQVHSWQPRLGFSWDVNGDSSLKIYGSAGDYSLPLDAEVALRGSSASIFSNESFSYTGVDPKTGAPLGLGPLPPAYAAQFPAQVGQQFVNGETGQTPNPGAAAATNLKPFKQREFILGAQQQIADWTFGIKATYRKVLTGTDDSCDIRPIYKYANEHYGFDLPTNRLTPTDPNLPGGCYIFNPGSGATLNFPLDESGKLYPIKLTADQIGEPKYKRSYESIELTAERAFDNVYYIKASYVWSKLRGNTEGLVDSNIGQSDTGTSELFDYPEIMQGTNGLQPNDREHTLKVYGAWQINQQWLVGANAIFQTGRPENCYGLNPIDNVTNGGYGSGAYLYCNGMIMPAGSEGRTPTYWNIDLNMAYKPTWAKGVTFQANVFNVFNKQHVSAVNETGEDGNGSSLAGSTFLTPTAFYPPRYVQISAEYDFNL